MQHQESRAAEQGRGRDAHWPSAIPWKGWKDILWRVWREIGEDRISLVAAGVTFYLLLALFPALAAFVSLYGFVADPASIADHISYLAGFLPSGGVSIISDQLHALVSQDKGALSFSFIIGFLAAFWSANNGIKALFEAMNIAYEETEKRGFIRLNVLSIAFTFAAMLVGILLIVSVGVIPAILAFLHLGEAENYLLLLLRWPIMLVAIAAAISLVYRYGPSRESARWRWIGWGGAIATIAWLLASFGFSFYLQHFANYNAMYGSLGAVIGFMVWTWISVLILLVGAEFNAEIEHQTARDTTTGDPLPMGERGAVVADTPSVSSEERLPI